MRHGRGELAELGHFALAQKFHLRIAELAHVFHHFAVEAGDPTVQRGQIPRLCFRGNPRRRFRFGSRRRDPHGLAVAGCEGHGRDKERHHDQSGE